MQQYGLRNQSDAPLTPLYVSQLPHPKVYTFVFPFPVSTHYFPSPVSIPGRTFVIPAHLLSLGTRSYKHLNYHVKLFLPLTPSSSSSPRQTKTLYHLLPAVFPFMLLISANVWVSLSVPFRLRLHYPFYTLYIQPPITPIFPSPPSEPIPDGHFLSSILFSLLTYMNLFLFYLYVPFFL